MYRLRSVKSRPLSEFASFTGAWVSDPEFYFLVLEEYRGRSRKILVSYSYSGFSQDPGSRAYVTCEHANRRRMLFFRMRLHLLAQAHASHCVFACACICLRKRKRIRSYCVFVCVRMRIRYRVCYMRICVCVRSCLRECKRKRACVRSYASVCIR